MISSLMNRFASGTQSQQSLQEEVEEFRALKTEINKARAVIEFDAKGQMTSINDNALKVLQYSATELVAQHHRILMDRSTAASVEYINFWDNLANGITQTGTFKLLSKTGKEVFFQGYYAPIRNSKSVLRKVVCYLTDITATNNNLIALQNEEEALSLSFGVVECGLDTNIIKCNDLFANPLGYTTEALIGKPIATVLSADVANSAEYKAMWSRFAKGERQVKQMKRISKTGEEYWFQAIYAPVKNAEGHIFKVIVYSNCITAEKNKNADYEGQINAISKTEGIVEFDLKGNILKVNENFAKVTGYEASDIVGHHHSMFVDAQTKASSDYKNFWDKLGQGEAIVGQYKRHGKGGKEIWLQASYNPILDLNGKPFKVVKYATDITAEKLKNADYEGQLNAIKSIQGIVEFSMDGNIINGNPIFLKAVGYTLAEIQGKHHSMFVDAAESKTSEYQQFWNNLAAGIAQSGRYKRIIKNGSEIWVQALYAPILDLNGKPYKVVRFASYVTEQVLAEKNLENAVIETQTIIEAAKSGDLTNRVSLAGKAGAIAALCDGVNALMDKMSEVIGQVREAGETINTAASEIATGNNDLSSRTEQQATSLQQTSTSMSGLSNTVRQNAENAKQANQLAAAASGVAVKGGEVVGNVVTTMSAINDSARKIEDIISVIDGIAFQTNILALNAAVEAARAGEQGRGFAVVAGEVRNLAQRSSSAAKEIKDLITDSVSKTAEGTKLVESAGATMSEIVSSVQRVTDIMGEITAASLEQSSGIDQVNSSITSMDEVTQQNAALVEEAAAAAESLVEQAASLMETVSVFRLSGNQKSTSQYASSSQKTNTQKASSQSTSHNSNRRASQSPMRQGSPASKSSVNSATSTQPRAKTGTDDAEAWEEF